MQDIPIRKRKTKAIRPPQERFPPLPDAAFIKPTRGFPATPSFNRHPLTAEERKEAQSLYVFYNRQLQTLFYQVQENPVFRMNPAFEALYKQWLAEQDLTRQVMLGFSSAAACPLTSEQVLAQRQAYTRFLLELYQIDTKK